MSVGVGLTRSAVTPMLQSSFPAKGASKYRPHGGSEPPVAQTGQHPGLRLGWTITPTRKGNCLITNRIEHSRAWRCVQSTAIPVTLGYNGQISIYNRLLCQVFDILVFVLLLDIFPFRSENNKRDVITLSSKQNMRPA